MDPQLFFDTPMTPDQLLFLGASVLLGCSLIIFCMVLFVLLAERQRYRRKVEALRRETELVQAQTDRIFSALRDEVHSEVKKIRNS